jgi:hypothetical protein
MFFKEQTKITEVMIFYPLKIFSGFYRLMKDAN